MNARKIVQDTLIRKKIIHWKHLASSPSSDKSTAHRARKNFWRLAARYPEILLKLGWDEGSVY
jgi:hypothetical protein